MADRDGLAVGIAGATGAVGRELVSLLEERSLPVGDLRLLASPRSAGEEIEFRGSACRVRELTAETLQGLDVVFFSAGSGVSRELAPIAARAGAVVIDNSSAFRMEETVPLVIPEINARALSGIRRRKEKGAIIANPNCSTIVLLMAVTPLHLAARVRRMVVSTYQAASGAGARAMKELESQAREMLEGREPRPQVFKEPCAFNVFSHDTAIGEDGYNVEETKMLHETRKIWGDSEVGVSATCVRVPVRRAHTEAIHVELEREMDEAEARELLTAFPGVALRDDREENRFPTPLLAAGRDEIFVGRIRRDTSCEKGLVLLASGDQLRKGAALNAVQIAEELRDRW